MLKLVTEIGIKDCNKVVRSWIIGSQIRAWGCKYILLAMGLYGIPIPKNEGQGKKTKDIDCIT